MRLIVLDMLSTNSLSAFSSATTTAPLNRAGPVRLVRGSADREVETPLKSAPTGSPPPGPKPRGTLLNIRV